MLKRMASIVLSVALVLTCLIAGLSLPAAAATNIISDGDFEGSLSKLWTWAGASETNIKKNAIISEGNSPMTVIEESDGNHCLQIPEPTDTSKTYDRYFYALNVAASKTYRLTLRYKGTGLRLYFHSSYCTDGKGVPTIADSTEWTTYTREFTTAASINKNFIMAIGHKASTGTVLVDDIQLTEVIDLTGVSLPEKVTLAKGASQKLTLTAEPENATLPAVTWTSSNAAVASVAADGTVTANAAGVAYITATAGSFSATTAVTVASTDNKWTDTNLLVNGDLEAETLSTNWANFTSEAASAVITHTTDPDDAENRVLKFAGSKAPNYKSISGAKSDRYYLFSFRYKGSGQVRVPFTKSYVDTDTVTVLNEASYRIDNTASDIRMYINAKSEWQTVKILLKTSASINTSWILQFGSYGDSTVIYLDDFSFVELGKATVADTVAGGSVSLDSGSASGTALTGLTEGATVTATVTPESGYMLVPGSLRYTTPDGFVKRILNKDGDFGTGAGNTFTFKKPLENIRVFADFVKTDSTDFAFGTVGTSVHVDENGANDGIRFLTRVNLTAFDASEDTLTLKYDGETYTVKRLGLLLKRTANGLPLTLESLPFYENSQADERLWGVDVYTAESGKFILTDYTEGYIDYTIAMTTTKPNETFNARAYTARGYLVLEKGGVETVLYADERTDSVNTALARLNGEISDDVTDVLPEGPVVPDEPDVPEIVVPADDRDYSNADLKILSIGNSYSEDAQGYLQKLATSQGKLFKCVNLYISGCNLKTHYNKWVSGEAAYSYQLNGNAKYTDLVSLQAVLASDQFDVITLQQASWTSVSYSNFQPYLNDLIAAIREKQPNAQIIIQQTWAYGDAHTNHTSNASHTGGTMAAMWEKVEAAYNSAASETGLEMIPAGQAIQNAQEELNKGGYSVTSIQRDEAHVSKTWGRYLLARLWYEALTGEKPTVTIEQLNTSVAADAAMEKLVADAIAAALAEYPVEEVV